MVEKIKRIKTSSDTAKSRNLEVVKKKRREQKPPESAKKTEVDPHVLGEDFTDAIAWGDAGALLESKDQLRRSIENATRSHNNDNEPVELVADAPVELTVEPKGEENEPAAEEQEESEQAAPPEAGPEVVAENAPEEVLKQESFPVIKTKLDKFKLRKIDKKIQEFEGQEKDSQARLKQLDEQQNEIVRLRGLQWKEQGEIEKRFLGKSSINKEVRQKAREELADFAHREELLKAEYGRESVRLYQIQAQKESFQQKAEEIRVRVAERLRAYVSPLEAELREFTEQKNEEKAEARIKHFEKQRAGYSKRLLEAKKMIDDAELDSTRLQGGIWQNKIKILFDDIDTKLDRAKRQKDVLVQRRVALESQIGEWKKLGEAFEKKTIEPTAEEQPEQVADAPAQAPRAVSAETAHHPEPEVQPEVTNFIRKWNAESKTPAEHINNHFANFVKPANGEALTPRDIERGAFEYFTIRRRGISNWPVISWVADFFLKRRIAKLQKGN